MKILTNKQELDHSGVIINNLIFLFKLLSPTYLSPDQENLITEEIENNLDALAFNKDESLKIKEAVRFNVKNSGIGKMRVIERMLESIKTYGS